VHTAVYTILNCTLQRVGTLLMHACMMYIIIIVLQVMGLQ